MTMEQIIKSSFCKRELSALLSKVDCNITNARFEEINGEEYVHIKLNSESARRICVTSDSLLAMTFDVLRAILWGSK